MDNYWLKLNRDIEFVIDHAASGEMLPASWLQRMTDTVGEGPHSDRAELVLSYLRHVIATAEGRLTEDDMETATAPEPKLEVPEQPAEPPTEDNCHQS